MNKIKAYLLLLTIALSAFAAACSSDDNDPVTPEITISENILANGMSFSKAGGTNTLSVKSNVTLEVTSNQDWCVVTPTVSASATVFKYTIDVKSNSTTDNRTSVITVKGGNLTETFNVIQTATEGLDLETVLFEDISAAGGTITVKVMTNGEPTITINDSWITEKTETRAMVDKTKTFIIAANTGKERTGTITFIFGDLPATTFQSSRSDTGSTSTHLLYPALAGRPSPIGKFCSRFPADSSDPILYKYLLSPHIFQPAPLLCLISKERVSKVYINRREPS